MGIEAAPLIGFHAYFRLAAFSPAGGSHAALGPDLEHAGRGPSKLAPNEQESEP